MAASFSLTGQLRLTPTWTDELNATDVVDSTPILQALTLADGTGNGQANCYWKDVRTVAANSTEGIDLEALPLKAYGGTATIALTGLRMIYIRNLSATNELTYDLSDVSFNIVAGGIFVWFAPRNTSLNPVSVFNSNNKSISISNGTASSIDYEIVIAGTKA